MLVIIHLTCTMSRLYDIVLADYDVLCFMQTGATPLFIASEYGHTSIVEYLIMKGATIDTPKKVQCILRDII